VGVYGVHIPRQDVRILQGRLKAWPLPLPFAPLSRQTLPALFGASGGSAHVLLSERLVEQISESDPGLLKLLFDDRDVGVDVRLIDPHAPVGVVAAMVVHDTVLGRDALGDLEGLVGPLFGIG